MCSNVTFLKQGRVSTVIVSATRIHLRSMEIGISVIEKDFDLFSPNLYIFADSRGRTVECTTEQKNGIPCPSRNGTTKLFGQSEFEVYSVF